MGVTRVKIMMLRIGYVRYTTYMRVNALEVFRAWCLVEFLITRGRPEWIDGNYLIFSP